MKAIPISSISEIENALSKGSKNLVLVDFDYTLFASNSIELFFANARPHFLIFPLLFIIRRMIPWSRIFSQKTSRLHDYIAVFIIICLTPWNLLLWRIRAKSLFLRYGTNAVSELLKKIPTDRIFIVSYGYDIIIDPLLAHSPWRNCRRCCFPFPSSFVQLLQDKEMMLKKLLDESAQKNAIFITDSLDDQALLEHVKYSFLISPTGHEVIATDLMHFPLRYAFTGKFEWKHALDQIFFVDLLITLLAICVGQTFSPWTFMGALTLFFSLIFVYEIGYFENDFISSSVEPFPRFRNEAKRYRGIPIYLADWFFGITFGVFGCLSACMGFYEKTIHWILFWQFTAIWLGVLLLVRLTFYWHNHLPVNKRITSYVMLQIWKSLGVFIIVRPTFFGLALALSQLLVMVINYAIYRFGGKYETFPKEAVRALMYILFSVSILLIVPSILSSNGMISFSVLMLWCLWRVVRARIRHALKVRLLPRYRRAPSITNSY